MFKKYILSFLLVFLFFNPVSALSAQDCDTSGIGKGNDSFDGGEGIDTIFFSRARCAVVINLLTGTAIGIEIGQDKVINTENVITGFGDDILEGDKGNNVLKGREGSDTYYVRFDHGNDIIEDDSNSKESTDRLMFYMDSPYPVQVKKDDNDLLLQKNESQYITVKNWFKSVNNRIEFVEFSQGELFSAEDVEFSLGKSQLLKKGLMREEAIEQDLKAGFIRSVTQKDVEDWLDYLEKIHKQKPLKSISKKDHKGLRDILPVFEVRNGVYIVVKDYTFPEGLYGAHSKTFVIAPGVKVNGETGHSTVYDMNTGACYGPGAYVADKIICSMRKPQD